LPLQKITSIGYNFLYQCVGLTSLDLLPLQKITSINAYFLSGCSGLTSLDLSPLQNITSVDQHFLYNCVGLTSLDLSPLQNITSVGRDFLVGCVYLTSIYHTPNQKPIILQENPTLVGLLKEKIELDPYWNYTEESRYTEDYAEFCEKMQPHSLIVLRKILDNLNIPYSKTASREKLCRILYNENKNMNTFYNDNQIMRMCNDETEDPISGDKFTELPKNEIIRLKKNAHGEVDRCYAKKELRKWCSEDRFRTTGTCPDPINRQDLYLSYPEEMKQLMMGDIEKYKTYFKKDVV
jgi:hypothetical protein